MNTIRNLAKQYWDNLKIEERVSLFQKSYPYFNNGFGYSRIYEDRLSREIETIFYNEVVVEWFKSHGLYELCKTMSKDQIIAAYLEEHTKEQPTENYRRVALAWWETLISYTKNKYFLEYQKIVFTPANNYTQLTGREIQNIWAVKTETKKAEMIPEQIEPQSVLKTIDVEERECCLQYVENEYMRGQFICCKKYIQPKAIEDNVWDEVEAEYINSVDYDMEHYNSSFLEHLKKNYSLIKK